MKYSSGHQIDRSNKYIGVFTHCINSSLYPLLVIGLVLVVAGKEVTISKGNRCINSRQYKTGNLVVVTSFNCKVWLH